MGLSVKAVTAAPKGTSNILRPDTSSDSSLRHHRPQTNWEKILNVRLDEQKQLRSDGTDDVIKKVTSMRR